MKLDYGFIKEILIIIEQQSSNDIRNFDLMQQLNIMSNNDVNGKINQDLIIKYVDHIQLLCENSILSSSAKNAGFAKNAQGGYSFGNATYKITMSGYQFLDALRNDTIFNKIKGYTLPIAINLGTQYLTQGVIPKIINSVKNIIS